MSMQTLTSFFLSSIRSPGVRLDDIIFYAGPPPTKSPEMIPLNANDWPDVDMILAEVSQHGGLAAMEISDSISNPNAKGEGRPSSPFLRSGFHYNTREVRHSELSGGGLDNANGDFSFDAFRRTQHPATELFRLPA